MTMAIADAFIGELEMESATTRRVLERVPGDRLSWRPHEKSSSLGQLALHVATLPAQLTAFVSGDRLDLTKVDTRQPAPASQLEIMAEFDRSLATARAYLQALGDPRASEVWTLCAGDTDLFAAPRAAVIRSFLFNHLYHHRGQLLVYLRLLNVAVPSVYGPTADENPFAGAA
jgi:uncharacterized damage-inducible protein DinB